MSPSVPYFPDVRRQRVEDLQLAAKARALECDVEFGEKGIVAGHARRWRADFSAGGDRRGKASRCPGRANRREGVRGPSVPFPFEGDAERDAHKKTGGRRASHPTGVGVSCRGGASVFARELTRKADDTRRTADVLDPS